MVSKTKISIITPCLNEKENITECYTQVKNLFKKLNLDYEHIFTDNKSTDGTREILKKIANQDKKVKLIFNTRNFDPFKSTFNALKYAKGNAVVLSLAADLQDPVEIIENFINQWKKGYKVVYGIRKHRKDGFIRGLFRKFFYSLFGFLSTYSYGHNVGEFMLVDSKVHKLLISIEDQFPYIRGIVKYLNFKSIGVEFNQAQRTKGLSRYSILSHFPQAINAFISFSNMPIRFLLYSGFLISASSILYGIYLFYRTLMLNEEIVPGIRTLIVSVFILFGIVIFFLGIIGEYIVSIHNHVRKKPLVVEEEKINFN